MNNLSSSTNKLKSKLTASFFSTVSTGVIVVFSFFYILKKEIYNIKSVEMVETENGNV